MYITYNVFLKLIHKYNFNLFLKNVQIHFQKYFINFLIYPFILPKLAETENVGR